METDHVLLPLVQYPTSGAQRVDRVGGPVGDEIANSRAFQNFGDWEDVDGDGQIVIGAEQWPGRLNPVTECATSPWALWTAVNPVLPAIWDTTASDEFVPTALVVGEPVVETAGRSRRASRRGMRFRRGVDARMASRIFTHRVLWLICSRAPSSTDHRIRGRNHMKITPTALVDVGVAARVGRCELRRRR